MSMIYRIHEHDMGTGATRADARNFADVCRRYFAHIELDAEVSVGIGYSDPGTLDDGNRAFDAFCAENFDVDATCAALGC